MKNKTPLMGGATPPTPTKPRNRRECRIWAEAYSLGRSEAYNDGIKDGTEVEKARHGTTDRSKYLDMYITLAKAAAQNQTEIANMIRSFSEGTPR